ncbi:MAG: hypothetical protein HUU49_03325 [Candidatus Buchananbacteria bacterium]|nr:hypothetical protein [Candidatus Buchananbacteria bacterium]
MLKKVREHLNEQLLAKEKTAADFEFQRVQAIEMANDLLCEAWNIFSLGSLSVRIQALNIILSVQKYIAELSGAMVGVATRNIIAQKYGEDWVKELVSRNKYAGMSTAELQSRLDYLHQEIEKQEQEKLKK